MSAPSSSGWILTAARRRAGYADLRISDAERAEVADLLSRHYGDGRLDQDEFNQRLDQAMRARTYSDLSGLLADLPPAAASGASGASGAPDASGPPARRGRRHWCRRFLFLALVIVLAVAVAHALASALTPLVLLGLLAAIVLYTIRR